MSSEGEEDFEWEEWDGKGVFWHHCVAGSIAGVSEHALMYPFDTVKTHLQSCAACPHSSLKSSTSPSNNKLIAPRPPVGMWTTMRHLVSQAGTDTTTTSAIHPTTTAAELSGMSRLWRGVYTIILGCIPAHALYFSTYESIKYTCSSKQAGEVSSTGAMLAGAAAAMSHDAVMAPLDTIKQRLQLGHYQGMQHAFFSMVNMEGYASLYRSFPITLLTNIPHGMVLVSTNECLKRQLLEYYQTRNLDMSTCLMASSVAGMTAAATTTPLDRIKTFLQTQQLQPACNQGSCPKLVGEPIDLARAVRIIYTQEGMVGFFRGMAPRVISHTPAVAISWTTYETAKQYLATHYS